MVMRPTPLSPVSRAMLRPPPELFDSIRARIAENVSFFGDTLTVEGFPFTQQDTQLCRCAHSAAWMCHYAGYLRGDVARVPRGRVRDSVQPQSKYEQDGSLIWAYRHAAKRPFQVVWTPRCVLHAG